MNDPKLDLLIKEKMQKYVPHRSIQVMHCGVIVLVSIVIGALNIQPESGEHQGPGAWLGVTLAASGLALYFIWSSFLTTKARKEANAEFLAASLKKPKGK